MTEAKTYKQLNEIAAQIRAAATEESYVHQMTMQAEYVDLNNVHYSLFVGNNARASIVVKDLDCGMLVMCRSGSESEIRSVWRRALDKTLALDMAMKNAVAL